MDLAIEMLVRSLALFAIAGGALLWLRLRRASAASRHLVYALTLTALLFLPAASLVLPARNVAVLPPPRLASEADMALLQESALAESYPLPDNALATEPVARPVISRRPERHPIPWPTVAFYAYLAGVILLLTRAAIGRVALLRWARNCREAGEGEPLRESQEAAARELGVRRPVRLLAGASGAVPATWGTLRPVLLLPDDARHWSPERLRAVLLHEMAHIRRADSVTSAIANAACTLWWFHPLVWWAAAQMRCEAERACDDQVVVAGVPAIEYAGHLLEAGWDATTAAHALPIGAIAMATRRPSLRTRFDAVLDRTSDRRAIRPGFALCALVITAGLLVTVATLRPAARAEQSPSSPYIQRFPNGLTVELLGVTDASVPDGRWWSPDGTRQLKMASPLPSLLAQMRSRFRQHTQIALLRIRYPHEDLIRGQKPSEACEVNPGTSWRLFSRGDRDHTLRYVAFSSETSPGAPVDQAEMFYHISLGPWETIAVWPAQANADKLQTKYGEIHINWDPAHDNRLTIMAPASDLVMRIRRKAADGTYYPGDGGQAIPLYTRIFTPAPGTRGKVSFDLPFPKSRRGEPLPDAFELQVRPSYTAAFWTVALRAGDSPQKAAEEAKGAKQRLDRGLLEEQRRMLEQRIVALRTQQSELERAKAKGQLNRGQQNTVDAEVRALSARLLAMQSAQLLSTQLEMLRNRSDESRKEEFVRSVQLVNRARWMQWEGYGEHVQRLVQQLEAQRVEISIGRTADEARAQALERQVKLLKWALKQKTKTQQP